MPGDGRRLIGPLLWIVLVFWLGFRITQAVDLSDESYYAVFLVTWLKQGISASPFLSLHQTAALIVYPAAVLFFQFAGSTDGLILFLRALYVLGALVAASSAVLFLQCCVRGWTLGSLGRWFSRSSHTEYRRRPTTHLGCKRP